jgi:hypothetical protein
MAEKNDHQKDGYFSKVVRAGKRTYFFDVKSTKKGEHYLTITESKRRFNNEQGKFFYEKFKIFLYKEDFEKFTSAMEETLRVIESHNEQLQTEDFRRQDDNGGYSNEEGDNQEEAGEYDTQKHTNLDFEDLGRDESGAEDESR